MKILKLTSILLLLVLFNTNSFAEDCDSIKMDSSVNIIKKIKCKAGDSSASSETSTSTDKKKDGWSLWKKPEWMKKKN